MPKPPENSVHPKSRKEWRAWLEKNHTRQQGVWLITYKKTTGNPRIDYGEAVEEALCFGWVDSKGNKLDDERSMLWMAPRKRGSKWSKLNKERVEKLTRAGLMAPAGLAKVEAAKQDDTWSALDAVEALEIPADLKAALDEDRAAKGFFEAFPRSVKRGILEWILNAKRPETRAKRIAETVELAAKNIRANQWRQSSTTVQSRSKNMDNGFEEILETASPPARELAREARSLIQSVYPGVVEVPWPRQRVIGYGVGPKKMSEHFCYISVSRNHINIGFMYGAELPDPEKLQGGTGKLLRHVRITDAKQLSDPALRELLNVASKHRMPAKPSRRSMK